MNLLKNNCLLQIVLDKHCSVFNDELGCMNDMKVKLLIDSTAKPRFFKPHSVPFTLRDKVETELQPWYYFSCEIFKMSCAHSSCG